MKRFIIKAFVFIGSHPVVDFANTHFIPSGNSKELFESYEDAQDWFIKTGLLHKAQALSEARKRSFLAELKDYRALLKESFKNITQERPDIDILIKETNRILSESRVNLQVSHENEGYHLDFYPHDTSKNLLLSLIAIQTAKLLSSKEFQNLKKCHNENCALYFIDTSKNHSRRWCSMEVCGNRAKVSSFSKRAKKS